MPIWDVAKIVCVVDSSASMRKIDHNYDTCNSVTSFDGLTKATLMRITVSHA